MRRQYSPFGIPNSEGDELEFGFHGELYDPVTGLTYLRQRFLHNETGRFISRDQVIPPPGDVDNQNSYAFADNDPINNRDPSGEFVVSFIAGVLGVTAAVGSGVVATANVLAAAYSLSIGYRAYQREESGRRTTGMMGQFAIDALIVGITISKAKLKTRFLRRVDYVKELQSEYLVVDLGVGLGASFGFGEVNVSLFTEKTDGEPTPELFTGHVARGGIGAGLMSIGASLGFLEMGDGVGWYYSTPSWPSRIKDIFFVGASLDAGAHGYSSLDTSRIIGAGRL